jgi:hypothetical protein
MSPDASMRDRNCLDRGSDRIVERVGRTRCRRAEGLKRQFAAFMALVSVVNLDPP